MLIDNRDNGGSKCIYLNAGPSMSIVTVSRLMRKYTHMHTDTPYQ